MLAGARRDQIASRCETDRQTSQRQAWKFASERRHSHARLSFGLFQGLLLLQNCLSHQQAWSSGYDFCLTTQVFGYTEGSEFDSQGL
jgi:hypothetical protein